VHPQPSAQQAREETQRKEEARREEQERRQLESQLRAFDSYSFYGSIEAWAAHPIPSPIAQTIRLTPLRRKVIMHQPMPLTRSEVGDIRRLSDNCVRLLALLRAIDQRGIECPYIHCLHRSELERAIDKCARLKAARQNYVRGRGVFAWCAHVLNGLHLDAMRREVDLFQGRLEAVLMMCRHEEFAHDLVNLRREVTYRTELLLKPSEAPQSGRSRQQIAAKMPLRAVPKVAPPGR
jgi:hypothetical protein